MTIRQVTKEDQVQFDKIQSIAFEFPYDLKVNEDFDGKGCIGAFDDDGTLFAEMGVIDHTMYFSGHEVKSAGIGGVASLPHYRHNKGIRKVFEYVFDKMQEDDQVFSMLFPFSFSYYNKFGYETVYRKMEMSFDFGCFEHLPRNNSVKMVEERDCEDIQKLYEQYARKHNCALKRNEDLWKKHLPEISTKDKKYTYVYYREDGTAGGYFTFTPEQDGDSKTMKMHAFVFLEKSDLLGILGFLRNYEANYSSVSIANIPESEDFSSVFINQYDVSRNISYNAMARVADVARAFELMRYPMGEGSFTVGVTDEFLERNNGIYSVAYKDGTAVSVSKPNEGCADLEVDVKALAKLMLGTDDLLSYHMGFANGIKINANEEVLGKTFVKQSIFLGDYF